MSKKLFTGAMAAMMATGMVTPAMAETNVADLHKAAYEATQKALTEKTQLSINEARASIEAFKAAVGTHADISTWSSMVDSVQHPIYVQVVDGILALDAKKKAGTKVSQAEVNKLYELLYNAEGTADDISAEYLAGAKYGWSGLTDAFQNDLTVAALNAVQNAKTTEEVAAARVLVEELATSKNKDAAAAAVKLEAVVVEKEEALKYTLKVTEVVDVTKTSVSINFEALVDAVENATVEVKDNKGNVVPVDSVKVLIEGETEAKFNFSKALTTEPTGTWTINGFAVDLSERAFIADFNYAVNNGDALLLAEVIKTNTSYVTGDVYDVTAEINNIKVAGENSYAYLAKANELLQTEDITTVAQIQTIINDGNKEVANAAKVRPLVEIAKTGTLNQFTALLKDMTFDRVNSEWVSQYKTAVAALTVYATVSEVQTALDGVNAAQINTLVNKATTNPTLVREDIEAALEVVNQYAKATTDAEKTAKEALVKELNTSLAIVRINEAITQTQLKSALNNLATVAGTAAFDYATLVNESILKDYLTAMQAAPSVTIDDVKAKLVTGYNAAEAAALTDLDTKAGAVVDTVEANATQTEKDAFVASLNKLATVTAKNTVKFDATKVNAQLAFDYATVINSGMADVAAVTTAIATVNNNIVSITLSSPSIVDADTLLTALQSSKLALTNVVAANKAAYFAETSVKTAGTKDALVKAINEVNYKETIRTAKTVAEVKIALVNYVFSAKAAGNISETIANLTDAARTDVAELVLVETTKETPATLTTVADLDTLLASVNVDRVAKLGAVNTAVAGTITDTVTALEAVDANFKALDAGTKLVVAEKFRNAKPVDKDGVFVPFTNFTAIRTLVAASK